MNLKRQGVNHEQFLLAIHETGESLSLAMRCVGVGVGSVLMPFVCKTLAARLCWRSILARKQFFMPKSARRFLLVYYQNI